MGQISPLDQLISSSAFNDCSVTVIYSGVIIADVLLLCDGPSGPPQTPHPSSSCADVIVFFGTTPASFTVVLYILFLSLQVLLKCTFASVAWLAREGVEIGWTRVTASPDQRDCQTSREMMIAYSPRTNHSAACLNLDKTPNFNLSCLRLTVSLSSTLYYQMCILYMCECEWVCRCPARSCVRYLYAIENVCTDFLSSSVFFNPAGTNWLQLLLEYFWLSVPFFSSLELKKLTQIQPYGSPSSFFSALINHIWF